MSRYPEDLLVDPTLAATHEQARLEAQKKAYENPQHGIAIGDPAKNPVYTIEETDVVTPALAQQSHEVLARHTAATALGYPVGDKTGAEANIQTVKDAFGITDPVVTP